MFSVGPRAFYSGAVWCDYPPGYLYVLGLQGLIGNLLNLAPGSAAYLVLLKLPAIASDAAICYLRDVCKRQCIFRRMHFDVIEIVMEHIIDSF